MGRVADPLFVPLPGFLTRLLTGFLAVFLAVLLAGPVMGVQTPGAGESTAPMTSKEKNARATQLQHWRSLDDETRKEMRRRYERIQGLSSEDRQRLLKRAARLQAEMLRVRESLNAEEKAAMDALPAGERRKALRGLVGDRARAAAANLRWHMTPDERAKLSHADSKVRARILRAVRERNAKRIPQRVAALAKELGLSPAELQGLSSGGEQPGRKALVRLLRRRVRQALDLGAVSQRGLRERAERMLTLNDGSFIHLFQRTRMQHPSFAVSPQQWEAQMQRRQGIARRLHSLATPTPQQRAKGPRGGGRWGMRRRAVLANRAAIEGVITRRLQLPADLVTDLRALGDDQFVRVYRMTIEALNSGADFETMYRRRMAKRQQPQARQRQKTQRQ